MHTSSVSTGLLFLVALAAMAGMSAALLADPIRLGNVPPPGTKFSSDMTMELKSQYRNTQAGQTRTFNVTTNIHRIATIEVLAVKDGAISSLRVTFGEGSEMTAQVAENPAANRKVPYVYAGKTITVTRGDDGKVTDDAGVTADVRDVKELHHSLVGPTRLFPKTPVSVGDEWNCDPAAVAEFMGIDAPGTEAQMKMKLVSVQQINGRPTAEIAVTSSTVTKANNNTTKIEGTATQLFDIATGVLVKLDNHVAITSSGDSTFTGPQGTPVTTHSEGSGTGSTSITQQLLAVGADATAAMNAAPPAAPAAAAGPGVNPLAPDAAPAAPYAGSFSDGKLSVNLSPSGGQYAGTFELGGQKFPATARPVGAGLEGSFTAGGHAFPFTATISGDTLSLTTPGATASHTYTLKRAAANPLAPQGMAPANPLAPQGIAPANPAAAPVADDQSLGEFSELASNASGKTLFAKFKGAANVETAIAQTRKALADIFDAKPTCSGGFADAAKQKGGADFTATLKGQPMRGWMLVGVENGVTTVNVVYCRADASQKDMSDLLAGLPGKAKTTTFTFPDGSGTIELAANWHTQSRNCLQNLIVNGPQWQLFSLGVGFFMNTPDCDMVKMAKNTHDMQVRNVERTNAMSARFPNIRPLPMPPPLDLDKQFAKLTFCPLCKGPDDLAKYFLPVLAARQNTERVNLKVVGYTPAQANPGIPNAQATVFTLSFSWRINGSLIPMRSITKIDYNPILDGRNSWSATVTEMIAPEDSFARDVALMNDMRNSIKPDPAFFEQQNRDMIAASKIMNDAFQKNMDIQNQMFQDNMATQNRIHKMRMDASADRFAHQQANVAAQRAATTASSKDMAEFAGGLRDVYDRKTGEYTKVDLFNSRAIVQGLNDVTNEKDRFIEIPLRDQP